MRTSIAPPVADDYAPFYSGYISAATEGAAEEGDVVALLERQLPRLRAACAEMSDDEARGRYAPGKWSIKDVIGHMTDAERIFAYRALRIGRGDATPLPGFEQNDYVAAAASDRRPLADLLAELESVRAATLQLVRALDDAALDRRGTASNFPVSVRALVYMIAGHAEHHLRILRDRYGVGATGAAAGMASTSQGARR